ncbi:MAG: methionyl-tRNA formyltransferase [Pirellulaceae bacterium]
MMGTGPFAVPTFEALIASDHTVLGLVTRPPRPVQTGRRSRSVVVNPMRDVAERHGLSVWMPEDINGEEAHQQLQATAIDLLVVCDYGQILSDDSLRLGRLGGINLHASLLPAYRGAAPINWAIWDGLDTTGVTVIHMTAGLDAGPCLVQRSLDIGDDDDAVTMERKLADLGVAAVLDAVQMLENWDGTSSIGSVQDGKKATRARRLRKDDGLVDWSRTSQQIDAQVRALRPWPGTFTHLQRLEQPPLRVAIEQVTPIGLDGASIKSGIEPGEIVEVSKEQFLVACGEGYLRIDRLQPAGKRSQSAAEFLRGYRLDIGSRFA